MCPPPSDRSESDRTATGPAETDGAQADRAETDRAQGDRSESDRSRTGRSGHPGIDGVQTGRSEAGRSEAGPAQAGPAETGTARERRSSRRPPGAPGASVETEEKAPDAHPWGDLGTEARHPASRDLDRLPTEDVVALLVEEDRRGLEAALEHRREVAGVAEQLAAVLSAGGSAVLAGAGTSGRLAVLEAAECPPTFGTDPQAIRAVMAGGEEAVFRAREGAEDREDDGRRAVAGLGSGDLVIGLSASSVTPFTRGALRAAREQGAATVLLTCASGEGLEDAADRVLALDTGPEILTGSTRLKAGSATKAVLNAITTAAMVRLDKVFENWMVDLRPTSAKLRDRSARIVSQAGGVSRDRAEALLAQADGHVKTALVMARTGLDTGAARRRLEATGGSVRQALES